MTFVLDASMTMAWCFDDEAAPATDAALVRATQTGAVVPSLWRLEVANTLQVAVRRNRIVAQYRDEFLGVLAGLPISVDAHTDANAWTTTLRLAEQFGLTLYDAAYLELARRRQMPLASLDKKLRVAARASQVGVIGVEE